MHLSNVLDFVASPLFIIWCFSPSNLVLSVLAFVALKVESECVCMSR